MTIPRRLSPALQTLLALAAALAVSCRTAPLSGWRNTPTADTAAAEAPAVADRPADPMLTNVRQLTFKGQRSGEGYFSRDGSLFVFQSDDERDPSFPRVMAAGQA